MAGFHANRWQKKNAVINGPNCEPAGRIHGKVSHPLSAVAFLRFGRCSRAADSLIIAVARATSAVARFATL